MLIDVAILAGMALQGPLYGKSQAGLAHLTAA